MALLVSARWAVHEFSTVRVIRGPVGTEVVLKIVRGVDEALEEITADKEEQRR